MKHWTMKHHKGVTYFREYNDAERVLQDVQKVHPRAHIVDYTRGFAIQFEYSGNYYCENVAL